MPDSLIVINNIMNEHEAVTACVTAVRHSNQELKKALTLTRISRWAQGNIDNLWDKLWNLKQAVIDLDEGFRNHYNHEVDTLPPIIGDLMMAALQFEHQEILERFDSVKLLLAETEAPDLKEKAPVIYSSVSKLYNLLAQHKDKEEGMLQLLKKLFESRISVKQMA